MAHKRNVEEFKIKPDFKIDFSDESVIRFDLLETFDYQFPNQRSNVVFTTEEFTSVCPWSGLPDFARVTVTYVPHRKILELRSVKYYLQSYRQVGMFQEHLTVRILNDLVRVCEPVEMTVKTDYNIRGGIHTVSESSYQRKARKRK